MASRNLDHYRQEIKTILYSVEEINLEDKENITSLMSDLTVKNAALVLKKIVIEAKTRKDFLESQASNH